MRPIHRLKTWPVFFEQVWDGTKTAEIRTADRDFQIGDLMELSEWSPETATHSGRWLEAEITQITSGMGLQDGFVMLSFEIIDRSEQQPRKSEGK